MLTLFKRQTQDPSKFMSNDSTAFPVTTGKRKRTDTYDELVVKFESLKDRYNAVVPVYNRLRTQLEQADLDYKELDERYQYLRRRHNTLVEIDWHADISPPSRQS